MNEKQTKTEETNGIDSFVGLAVAGLGAACLIQAGAWFFLRSPEAISDNFIGAEGLAVWSVIFILLGMTIWKSGRQT